MRRRRTDEQLVADALDHIDVLHRHLRVAAMDDQTVADAVALRLAAMIESIARGTDALRDRIFDDDWDAAWSTRNRIAHGYANIDLTSSG